MADPIRELVAARMAEQESRRRTCPFCLAPRALFKFDKRGAPYLTCDGCGSRAFLRGTDALRGIALVEAVVLISTGGVRDALWELQAALDQDETRALVSRLTTAVSHYRERAQKPSPSPVEEASSP